MTLDHTWPEGGTCQWCGEILTAPPIRAHNELFCRQSCVTAYRALRIKEAGISIVPSADTPA